MGFEITIELFEHDAGLHADRARPGVEIDDIVQMAGAVEDQRFADGLAVLGRAGAPRQHGYAFFLGDGERSRGVFLVGGHGYADGHDLVDRSVGAITPAIEGVEPDLPPDFPFQPALQVSRSHERNRAGAEEAGSITHRGAIPPARIGSAEKEAGFTVMINPHGRSLAAAGHEAVAHGFV